MFAVKTCKIAYTSEGYLVIILMTLQGQEVYKTPL